jgi:hypothetical protein
MREGPDVLVNALAGERVVFHTTPPTPAATSSSSTSS